MFLVTSADQRYWDKSQDILLIGEWCKKYSDKIYWDNRKYTVLPNPWDNTNKFSNDIIYIEKLSKKILPLLSRELNKIHNIERSEKYWKIILYPWLFYQIYYLYIRYLQIQTAKTSNLVTGTYILHCKELSKIVPNWNSYVLYRSDEYNQYIYGRIIEISNALPYTALDYDPNLWEYLPPKWFAVDSSKKNLLKRIEIAINDKIASSISMKYNRIQIIRSFMPYRDVIKLNIKLKQFPSIIEYIPFEFDNKCYSSDLRNEIKDKLLLSLNNNEFEKIFCTLIPELLPKVYIEYFKQISECMKRFTNKTKIVYSASGLDDPSILFYAAEICENNNGKLIQTQEGGSLGSTLYNPYETLKKEIPDIFLSWGWEDNLYQNIIAMPTTSKFNFLKDIEMRRNVSGRIMLIEADIHKYCFNRGMLSDFSYQNYIHEQFMFYYNLSKDAKKLLNIRLFPVEYTDYLREWGDKYPNANTDSKGKTFYEQLMDCRLAINSTNVTTFLECMVGNIPTILFINPKSEPIRPSAQPYFDMLHKVGILHYTPESAAKLVNEIYEDPMKWWMQPEIQEAKDTFCYHFARTSDDALDQLAKFLKTEYDKIAK